MLIKINTIRTWLLLISLFALTANTCWADMHFQCSVYQDKKLLTTEQKTIASRDFTSSWATNHPEKFAENSFKFELCKSVGLANDRQATNPVIKGVKYHNITYYQQATTNNNCQVRCQRIGDGNNTTPPVELKTLSPTDQNLSILAAATGYIVADPPR